MKDKLKRKRLLRMLERIPVTTVLAECPMDDALALVSAKQDMKLGCPDPEAYERALRVYHNLKRFDAARRGMPPQLSARGDSHGI